MLLNILMKKAFNALSHRIQKYKKKLIYWALALFVVQIFFFNIWWIWIDNEVFAQNTDTATQNSNFQEQAKERYDTMAFAQKVVYVLIYPVLIIAWKLVDNSLVYWEVFWFDAILWKLWVIVRNLANFWLWFIFIYKIFEFLIKGKKWDEIKKLLIQTLIAWVGIQASWFAMAALIDISTILTYWIWWLPISVLWGDSQSEGWEQNSKQEEYNPYILKTIVSVDAKDIDSMHTYLTNTDNDDTGDKVWNKKYISECEVMTYSYTWTANTWNSYSEELIIAPKMVYYRDSDWNFHATESDMCNYFGQVYQFSALDSLDYYDVFGLWFGCDDEIFCSIDQDSQFQAITNRKQEISNGSINEIRSQIENGVILLPWNAHVTWGIVSNIWTWVYEVDTIWLSVDNKSLVDASWFKTSKLQNLIDWDSYVWVFTALYSSLMNAWRNVIISDWSIYASLLNSALSLCHMLAIAIPLIVVALVFMMRIWVLWLAIALSPVIILLKAYELDKSDFMKSWVFEYLKLETLLPIIFSPAIVCFAVSMSTVLVRKIATLNWETIKGEGMTEILGWVIKLNIEGFSVWIWKLIVSVIWIAITWFLVWTAVEASKLWKTQMVKSLKWIANDAILSAKLVPIPWQNWSTMVGLWTALWLQTDSDWNIRSGNWIISRLSDKAKTEFTREDNEAVEQLFMNSKDKEKMAEEKKLNAYKTTLLSYNVWQIPDNWVNEPINVWTADNKVVRWWKDLNAESQKQVIKWINDLESKEVREKFGATTEVELKDWTKYKFNGDKYVPEKPS